MEKVLRKKWCLVLLLIVLFLGSSCSKKKNSDVDWINNGIAMIGENVKISDDSYIKSIRLLYDSLDENEKALVKDYQKLVDAEKKIYDLKLENGIIIKFDYSDCEVKLVFDSNKGSEERSLSDKESKEFLEKFNSLVGEKESKSGANKEMLITIVIGEEKFYYYYDSKYFTYKDITYVIIDGGLNFAFDYFK